eukprot:GHVT01009194.1.p1 GENE.GHVT01009194.1~~GHVT01009194.1.p1  ORF type:complete len:115 (+),score=15.55 GHVT01009194.1:364-708(+)
MVSAAPSFAWARAERTTGSVFVEVLLELFQLKSILLPRQHTQTLRGNLEFKDTQSQQGNKNSRAVRHRCRLRRRCVQWRFADATLVMGRSGGSRSASSTAFGPSSARQWLAKTA